MDYVIGCDVGSQSTKAVLLGLDGTLAGEAAHGYDIHYPQPLWAEQPAQWWTEALALAIRRVLADSGVSAQRVRGISLASQVEGVVPVDRAGTPLRPAILWMDRRAAVQCERARQRMSPAAVLDLTGLNLDPSHVAPKIRWIAEHQPEVYGAAALFLQPGSFAAQYLTGEAAVDYSNASAALLLDIRQRDWSAEMCGLFGIDERRLPPVRPATDRLGTLRPAVAEALGLRPATQVMVGSGDEHAACLGAGVVRAGLVGDIVGTAEPVCAASAGPAFDSTGLIETHCHAHPDLWLLENPGFVSGGNFRWYRDHFGGAESYAQLDAGAARVAAGSDGLIFLPCTMGATTPVWRDDARGTFFGFTLAHTRQHFARAILEGSAYAVRDLTDRMQAIGLHLEELRVMGGGAKSPLWNQIKADVTGLPVAVPHTPETTALGAALVALKGIGAYASLEEACAAAVHIQHRYEPQPQAQARYEATYALYRQTFYALDPVFKQAAKTNQ
jgi:xylulokinase